MVDIKTVQLHNVREWNRFEKNLNFIWRVNSPKAMQRTVNEIAKRSKTVIVRSISKRKLHQSKTGAFEAATVPLLPPVKVAQKHIRPLIYVRGARANRGKVEASIIGYTYDLSAIKLGKGKGGVMSGEITQSATHTTTKSGHKRRLAQKRVGGIKTGKVKLPRAFITQARRNQAPLLMMRAHKKTWRPGESGWKYPKNAAPYSARMPFGVVKFDVKTPMSRTMEPAVARVLRKDGPKIFDQQMGYVIGRRLATGK